MTWPKLLVRDAASVALWLVDRLRGRPAPAGLRILVYHAVADVPRGRDRWRMSVPPTLLAAQIRWLRRRGYAIVSLDDALEMVRSRRPMPPRAVALTFDDGFENLVDAHGRVDAAPIAVFIAPGYLDAPATFPWTGSLGCPLSWDALRRLAADPRVTVGSHSLTHRGLHTLPADEQAREVRQSKTRLEATLDRPVRWFAYPYGFAGSFSSETVRLLREAGYEAALTNILGANRPGDSPWTLKRTRIGWDDTLWRFRLKLAGAYDWLDRRPEAFLIGTPPEPASIAR